MEIGTEQPFMMVGGERPFGWFRGTLRRLFASPSCRRVIYEVEAGKRAFLQSLGAPELEPKVAVVPSGVPRRDFTRAFRPGPVRLIFVNSANINGSWYFALKGGVLLVEAFLQLKRDYPDLELFIRSDVPKEIRTRLQNVPGLRIVQKPLPWEELEAEFQRADIFVMPSYVTPSMAFLEAMSYELPIVATGVWATPEIISDGHNGLLMPNPLAPSYTEGSIIHYDSPAFHRAVNTVDPGMVGHLVARLRLLIEDAELRRRMGRQGRQLAAEKYSLERWRQGLKAVLDRALDEAS